MNFLSPALLGGLAAVAVPIAIHLLNKFRVKTVEWGAMRFLHRSLRKNERRVKIEDLILLLVRCLLVSLLVLAFARPVLQGFASFSADSGPVTAFILLDNSASMLQSNGVTTRFEEAKRAAQEWLDHREARSMIGLYLVSSRTEAVVPIPQPDLGLVRKTLQLAQPSNRGTDLAPALRQAFQVLKSTAGGRREIRIYTDSQTCAWLRLNEIRRLASDNPEVRVVPEVIGQRGENNIGIIALRPEANMPAPKQPYRVQAEIGNYGLAPTPVFRISLSIDGEPSLSDTTVPVIAPGASQIVNLLVNFPNPGPHTLTASIPADGFALDDQRTLAVDVVRRFGVVIAEGGMAESPTDRDGFYLANALLPFSRETAARSYLEIKYSTVDSLRPVTLEDVGAVFLANPGRITDETARTLETYVNDGGSLVIFPGPRTDPAQWKQNAAWSALLPAELGPATETADPTHPMAWQSSDLDHPVTALWNDPTQGNLGSVKTIRYFPLTLKTAPLPQPGIIASYTDKRPAVVEWAHGKGRVVLFSSTANPEWTNLPLHPAFVPLIQRLLGYLNRTHETRINLAPGDLFLKEVPPSYAGKQFSILRPGTGSQPQSAGQIADDGKRAFLRYSQTEALGSYRVFIDGTLFTTFAVQLDPAESDLRQQDPATIQDLAQRPSGKGQAIVKRGVITHEFWTEFMWAALAIGLLEAALAHWFSQAK